MDKPDAPHEEYRHVVSWRFLQARRVGLTHVEARLFAESDADLEQLRRLATKGCPATLIARIML